MNGFGFLSRLHAAPGSLFNQVLSAIMMSVESLAALRRVQRG